MTKKELKQIRDLNRELKKWQGKLDELRCQSLTNSPQWDIVPAGGGNSDKVSDIAVDIMRTEDVIKDLKAKIMLQEAKIIAYIANIDDSFIRQIMLLRYVSCKSWAAVAMNIGGNNTKDSVRMAHNRFLQKNF